MAHAIYFINEASEKSFWDGYAASAIRRLKEAMAGYVEDKAQAIEEIGKILMAHGAPENYYARFNEISLIIHSNPEAVEAELLTEKEQIEALIGELLEQMARIPREDIEKNDTKTIARDELIANNEEETKSINGAYPEADSLDAHDVAFANKEILEIIASYTGETFTIPPKVTKPTIAVEEEVAKDVRPKVVALYPGADELIANLEGGEPEAILEEVVIDEIEPEVALTAIDIDEVTKDIEKMNIAAEEVDNSITKLRKLASEHAEPTLSEVTYEYDYIDMPVPAGNTLKDVAAAIIDLAKVDNEAVSAKLIYQENKGMITGAMIEKGITNYDPEYIYNNAEILDGLTLSVPVPRVKQKETALGLVA